MIITSFGGREVFLVDDMPDWREAMRAEVSMPSDLVAGLTRRETRRGLAQELRVQRLAYRVMAQGAEALRLEAALRVYQAQPVAVPFWPAACQAEQPWLNGGLRIAFREDWSAWEIFEGSDGRPAWMTAADWVAPLLWGRLEKRELTWVHPDAAEYAVEFVEAGPAGWALQASDDGAYALGPAPSPEYAPGLHILPFEIAFEQPGSDCQVAILREQIGFGREPSETLYPQANARGERAGYVVAGLPSVGKLLKFFHDHAAGKAFWAPAWRSAARLMANVQPGDVVLHVADTAGVRVGDRLSVCEQAGSFWTPRVEEVLAGPPRIRVDAGPTAGFTPGGALVSQLLLCRFERPVLTLQFASPELAQCSLALREVAPELSPPTHEVIGHTLGALPTRCYLYELERVLGGWLVTDRWTSFERDLKYDNYVYAAGKVTHGAISQGLHLDRDEVELRMDLAAGGALLHMATLRMEAPLRLTIRSGDLPPELLIDGARVGVVEVWHAAALFSGEITRVSVLGNLLTARAISGGCLFDRRLPQILFQRGCNYGLFSAGCGLETADWTFAAQISDPGEPGYPFTLGLQNLARATGPEPVYTENFFAAGWAEFGLPGVMDGANRWQRRAILASSAVSGGALSVTLDRDPEPFPVVGAAVALYPGCDLTPGTCKGRFNNWGNFGGHPFMPLGNPSLVRNRKGSSGGKK